MEQFIWLLPLGFAVGTLGTLIGAGGGFILVPVLLLLYPDKSPETITSISMAVVFFNAVSGSTAYARMKKIDYKSGLIFAASTIPGSVLGSLTTSLIPRNIFNAIFGVMMLAASVYLIFKPKSAKEIADKDSRKLIMHRSLIDRDGVTYDFSYNPVAGVIISLFVGYISSLVGIGGGIIHVPVLVNVLDFPVHIATATSHFVLAITSFTSSVTHAVTGTLQPGLLQIIGLSIGVLFGAQLGAKLSKRLKGVWIIRCLAIALGLAGIRIFIMAF